MPRFAGRVDVDFFVLALNRLLTVAQLTRKVADPRNVLPAAMETSVVTVTGRCHDCAVISP